MANFQNQQKIKAWIQARVDTYGGVDKARPKDKFTLKAWRELCRHLDVRLTPTKRGQTLEDAINIAKTMADEEIQ